MVNDPTTFHSLQPFKNRTFHHVMPLKDDADFAKRLINPHSLKQFLQVNRSRPHMSTDELKKEYHTHSDFNARVKRATDAKHLADARKAVLRGQSFTEYLTKLYGPRIYPTFQNSEAMDRAVHAYAAVGGQLTAEEKTNADKILPARWKVAPESIAQETTVEGVESVQKYYESQVLHYEQRLTSSQTHMGKVVGEYGTFVGFALISAYLGYSDGHDISEKYFRAGLGAVEGSIPYLNLSDFLDTIGVPILPEERQEIQHALFGSATTAVHFEDRTKHDPVTNLLLDVLPWGMERRKQDFELTMQELDRAEELLAEQNRTVITPGTKFVSRTNSSPTVINRRTGAKYHLQFANGRQVSSP